MLGTQKDGPSPQKAACSKKDAGETHRNRLKSGMASRVQDQTMPWIVLLPHSDSHLHECQSFHLSGQVEGGRGE